MQLKKIALIPLILGIFCSSFLAFSAWSGQGLKLKPIYLLDTLEFQDVDHRKFKKSYLETIVQLLATLQLPSKVAQDVVSLEHIQDLIENSSLWDKVLKETDLACEKPAHRLTCENLVQARLHLFRQVKSDPEDETF